MQAASPGTSSRWRSRSASRRARCGASSSRRPGSFWCALAFGAGLLSLHPRHARWRPCFAGLCASLLSLALLGERAAISLIFFVSPLCVAALEIASRAAQDRIGRGAALALQLLAVAAVPLWQLTRDLTPLRYVDPQAHAVYQRLPKAGASGAAST